MATSLLLNPNGKIHKSLSFSHPKSPARRKSAAFSLVPLTSGRLVEKRGSYGVKSTNVPRKRIEFVRDIYTTLIDQSWQWTLLLFFSTYLSSWTVFALLYYLISYQHGDMELSNFANNTVVPCIKNGHTFLGLLLYSAETQGTIGFGYRYVTEDCVATIITSGFQILSGVIMEAFLVAVVITKLARPAFRAQTLIFSETAVIAMRNGKLCYMFRIGDMRKTHLICAQVRLLLIRSYITEEGEILPFQEFEMKLPSDGRIFLAWPSVVSHTINADSPLYTMGCDDFMAGNYEIVVILEGIIESTGHTTQARTSYRAQEILWGHRFEALLTYQSSDGDFKVDYARFHKTFAVDIPRISAQQLDFHSDTHSVL